MKKALTKKKLEIVKYCVELMAKLTKEQAKEINEILYWSSETPNTNEAFTYVLLLIEEIKTC